MKSPTKQSMSPSAKSVAESSPSKRSLRIGSPSGRNSYNMMNSDASIKKGNLNGNVMSPSKHLNDLFIPPNITESLNPSVQLCPLPPRDNLSSISLETRSPTHKRIASSSMKRNADIMFPHHNIQISSSVDITSKDKMNAVTDIKPRSPSKRIAASPVKRKANVSSPQQHANVPVEVTSHKKLIMDSDRAVPSNNSISAANPIEEAQSVLRLRISQLNQPPIVRGYEKERKQLSDLIKRTASTGESNSLLLIGPRGCGKSMLMKDVLDELYTEESLRQNMMLVKLNGLLQTDDKIALREITRQLKLENTVGDKVFGSFAETLRFLLEALKKGNTSSKPTLFVLEEFDLFAQHKNQTLLYNLFDVSQSAQAPVCVIGVTCRLDVVDLLEKRVKSRFSHRQLHLFNKVTLGQYRDLCEAYLKLGPEFSDQQFAKSWNLCIEALLQEVSVKDIMDRQFSLTNDIRGLISLLTYPICQVSPKHPNITASDMVTSFKLLSSDTKSAMLHGISILELCLIIAMKHLVDIYDGEPFNFEMVYSEYMKFARRRSGMQVYDKPVVMKAYEHLQTLELIRGQGAGGGSTHGQKEYKLMNLLVHPSQILDALQKYPSCSTEIKQWANQSVL